MAAFKSYQDLKVWQDAVSLVESVYRITSGFPAEDRFGLTSQIRRAAVSVPSNIAEGHARSSARDFMRHLAISRGSLAELETQILIAHRIGYLSADHMEELASDCDQIGKMLRGLLKSLNTKVLPPPAHQSPRP
ncbi:four helix bundle protein [Pseudoxanthomonas mexicana]|uniref:four helix bundle protein n=1 Tax=Pseudoxanthomonas mexicana TaxID=128785 RepID=UPI00398B07F2